MTTDRVICCCVERDTLSREVEKLKLRVRRLEAAASEAMDEIEENYFNRAYAGLDKVLRERDDT